MLDILALMMKSKLFRHFTRNECLGICQISCPREKQFEKNRIIVSQGDKAAYIGIIHNGRIAGSKFYDNGDSHLFHIWSENDILGLEAAFSTLGTYPFTLTALENLSVLIFARDKILSDLLSMEI
ncbi:MAG: cyclic nucleotide-binding domain-containing protein, partial [Clostridiales bacterium]